jgi:hypothetical protein
MACLESSPDGFFCKEFSGRRVLKDFGIDSFDITKWKALNAKPLPVHDMVNGWLVVGGSTGLGVDMIYDDPALLEVDEILVTAEVYATHLQGYLPGVICATKVGDGDNHFYAMKSWVISPADRQTLGRRVGGSDVGLTPTSGTVRGAFYWHSIGMIQDAPNVRRYGSENDTNWPMQDFSTHLLGRTGKGGMRFWRIGTQTDEARVRKYAEYVGNGVDTTPFQIAVKNVPDLHRIHIQRTSPAASASLDNVSGGLATMKFDCVGFPVPLNTEKKIPPWSKVFLTTIADPGTVLGTFSPSIGVNWGDVYDLDVEGEIGAGCPPAEEGIPVLYGDCEEGIDVTYTGCEDGSANPICP